MGTTDKFIARLNRIPRDVTFKELHCFLIGNKVDLSYRIRGSHYIYYYDEDDVKFVIPSHGIVKTAYIRQVVQFLEERGIESEE